MTEFEKKVQGLQERYNTNGVRGKGYDLLEQLMIEALLSYLRDPSAPLAARESYTGQAERLIGDACQCPVPIHSEEDNGKDPTA